ncbi:MULTISPECIES: phage gp6-like head-tail connector protein [unclassified Streptomyces]|uniref:phage gp6-like head-tail connector protein n=1 Tax=unclassified Streptomyces TaxID=2593676 RepID=UPI0022AF9224|nr:MULTISPECIES: phage gp6-like head-tail connector protein [unclassified Streptomyces]MCZ4097316.1 phage gp6-like head-tail connector protein [Streptomyces sp. H39-C1]MCZ4120620.1 phage gp6-like head-tail connector protein [Streptomyces sp. H39-S7]
MSLATVEDVAVRLGRPVTDEERPRISAFLDDVSALVTDHCGADFQFHRDEPVLLDLVPDAEVALPRFMRPVLAVTSVVAADGTPVMGRWLYRRGSLWFPGGWQLVAQEHGHYITVTATYGYPAVPPAVVAIVCAEVARWLAVQPGVMSERVGDLEISYGLSAPSQGLSAGAQQALRKYRRTVTSREVRRSHALR